jgi:regulator of protease activity HflC (stomatin/prohibitin superfamily)
MSDLKKTNPTRLLIKGCVWLGAPLLVWYLTNLVWNIQSVVEIATYAFLITLELVLIVFMALGPVIAPHLVTTVSSPKHIWLLPLFSDLENGRAKAIVDTGNNLRRHIMNYNDADFTKSGGEMHADEYWDVEDKKGNELNARNWWEQYVEEKTGLVFVGIYPFRRVLHRPVTLRNVRTKNGKSQLTITPGRSKENPDGGVTDHVRVREFDWGVEATVVVQGFYRIRVLMFIRCKCVNPNKMLFGVDSWSDALNNALEGRIVQAARGMTLETLMNEEAAATRLADEVKDLNHGEELSTEKNWGLKLIQARVMNYDLSELLDEERKALTAVEVATRNKKAKILNYEAEAEGQAKVVSARAEAIQQRGAEGLAASQHEALETASKEGAVTIITGLGGGSGQADNSDLLKAILAELKTKEGKK